MDDDRLLEIEGHQEDIGFDEDDTDDEGDENVEEEDDYEGEDGEEDGHEDEDGEEEDDDEEDNEDEEVIRAERSSSRVSSITSQGPVLIDECVGKSGKNENEGGDTSEIDVCPICFKAWTSGGDHRICCLPCGHIYGMSCINKWLLRSPSSGKCPQCKSLCTLKEVIVLYATRLSVANEDLLHRASSNHFPPTEEGFSAFQQFVFNWLDSSRQRIDALERRLNSLEQTVDQHVGRARENNR